MKRSLAVLAALSFGISLAGCAWYAPRTDVGQSLSYRSGPGVIESVARAPTPFTASAGGSAASTGPTAPEALYRLKIRMDDGQVQYIDTSDTQFQRGMRVRLTDERLIEKQ
jgi:hypothetical protein